MADEKKLEAASALPGYTAFRIGGRDVMVPPLTLSVIEIRDRELSSLAEGMTQNLYANTVLLIAATSLEAANAGEDKDPTPEQIDRTFLRLKRGITVGEMRALVSTVDQLLINSGYSAPGEAQAATDSPGIGTSTESPQTLQSGESAEATQSESSGSLH